MKQLSRLASAVAIAAGALFSSQAMAADVCINCEYLGEGTYLGAHNSLTFDVSGFRHTAIIHSRNVRNMSIMAHAMDTTLFIKNGASPAGLGLGGEGYLSFSIATPTGEGVTNPLTFTRVRRCCMVDDLRIV